MMLNPAQQTIITDFARESLDTVRRLPPPEDVLAYHLAGVVVEPVDRYDAYLAVAVALDEECDVLDSLHEGVRRRSWRLRESNLTVFSVAERTKEQRREAA
jgi:hypothetical protein